MAEMRNPKEFWKSFALAWSIIVAVYMTFRLYIYSQQGQFTYIPAIQGIGSYVPRTVGNSINIVVHVVAAAMYGNVCLSLSTTRFSLTDFMGPNSNQKEAISSGASWLLVSGSAPS